MYYLIACGRWYQRDQKMRPEESVPTEEDDGPLQMHTAIEGFYEATDFSGLARTLSRDLEICFRRCQLP